MTAKCCDKCGQPLPPPMPDRLKLSPIKRRIFDVVSRSGITGISAEALADRIYADQRDGGPGNAVNTIHTLVCQINIRIRMDGLRIESRGRQYVLSQRPLDHKLTAEQVNEIRTKYASRAYKQVQLAAEYHTTQAHVSDIVRHKVWKNLQSPPFQRVTT